MHAQSQPSWQPLTMLPMIAELITGMANEATNQVGSLRQAETRPHGLDAAMVNRVIAVSPQTQDDLWRSAEQLRRWQVGTLSVVQREEIADLTARLANLRADLTTILALVERLKPHTLDERMARPDIELGLDALLGRHPPHERPQSREDEAGHRGTDR
jgi:hypothetical protein